MTDHLCDLTISELSPRIARREVSPVDLLESVLARIAEVEEVLNCYVAVHRDDAVRWARQAEAEIAAGGYRGPLHGIPVALKDIFDVAGMPTTASSRIMADHVAEADSTVAAKLKEAGAVMLGKTNLHEFAFGITTNNPHYGPTRNPWDTSRVPGGSSGGSGAAVAASLCTAATGTDTGGSIRIPAAVCGVVGLKPTYGRVSKAGVLPLAWSLDHAGPIAKSVEDAALFLQAIAGYDPADPSSARVPVPNYAEAVGSDVARLRVGVPSDYFFANLDPEVETLVGQAVMELGRLMAGVREVKLPRIATAAATFPLVIQSEAAAFHLPWLRSRAGDYGADVRGRLEAGSLLLATQYLDALRARSLLLADFESALREVDVIATPTVPMAAVPIDEESVELNGGRQDLRSVYTRCTSPINLVGLPAISIPCGFTEAGLPVGLQLIGRAFDEATLIAAAYAYESNTTWHRRRPAFAGKGISSK